MCQIVKIQPGFFILPDILYSIKSKFDTVTYTYTLTNGKEYATIKTDIQEISFGVGDVIEITEEGLIILCYREEQNNGVCSSNV